MRAAVAAIGRDPAGIGVVGTLPTSAHEDRSLDVAATMDRVPPLVDAGVTDFRARFAVPDDRPAALDHLHGVARAFREVVGRSDES